jgi:hypothetical protein
VIVQPNENPTQFLSDLFSYCGRITNLYCENAEDGTVRAYITFDNDASVRTALIINGSPINDRPIFIELASENFTPPVQTEGIHNQEEDVPPHLRSVSSVIAKIVGKGYKISNDAVEKAKQIDDQSGFTGKNKDASKSVQTKVGEIDEKLKISETLSDFTQQVQYKINEVDEKFEISNKTKQIGDSATAVFQNIQQGVSSNIKTLEDNVDKFITSHEPLNKGVTTAKSWGQFLKSKTEEIAGTISNALNPTISHVQQQVQTEIESQQQKIQQEHQQIDVNNPTEVTIQTDVQN